MNSVHLVDASIYVFRSYYSVTPEFFDHEQQPVHAVYGFLNTLLGLLDGAKPTHMAVCFDESLAGSFRNEIYPAYKANRDPAPPDLLRQFAYCKRLAAGLGLCVLRDTKYEADDLIGSALARLRDQGFRGVLVTGDKDLSQLLGEHDYVDDPSRRERTDAQGVKRKFGVRPNQFADYLALTGDAVDNIPGIRGIGPKTAATLLGHFGSLDDLLARVEEVPYLRIRGAKQLGDTLRAHREDALLYRQLSAIATDAEVPVDESGYRVQSGVRDVLEPLLEELRFGPLTRRKVLARCGD
ncbi:MAG: exodeoxyribonuclease IX [Ahniella sp.]|nr:exodeoxyribonuclease IX [Ahniella sp.]